MREVRITPVLNGFIVTVGCQTVVFTSMNDLLRELKSYQIDSASVEKEYLSGSINKVEMDTQVPTTTDPTFGVFHPSQGRKNLTKIKEEK